MSITSNIIVTDTNIITDLHTAGILDKFVSLNNTYISDMVKNDEINYKTGNLKLIEKFKVLPSTSEQLMEVVKLRQTRKSLSSPDIINFIIARDINGVLATGDDKLKKFAEENGVKVIRTLKIIELLRQYGKITIKEETKAYTNLFNDDKTRIPKNEIEKRINQSKVVT